MPTSLHSPTCLHGERPTSSAAVVVCCRAGQLVAVVCPEACAGRRIRWLCLPAVPVLRAVLFACLPSLPAMPTALIKFLPPFILLVPVHFASFASLPLFHSMCARITAKQGRRYFSVRASSLPATKLSRWQLQHGPAVAARAPVHLLTPSFFLQSP